MAGLFRERVGTGKIIIMLKKFALGVGALLLLSGVWLAFAVTGYPSALRPIAQAPQAVLIDNVRLVSMAPDAPEAEEARAILIVNGSISEIGDAGSLAAPEGLSADDVILIDGEGRTLLPGLIDAHVHVWDEAELAGYLAHGVTGIRNLSGMPFHLPLIERIEAGRILGPDMITTGPILNSPGQNQQDNHQIVVTAEDARAAVNQQYEDGYRALKLYSNLHREPFEAILEEADRLGMSVSGHTPEGARGEGVPFEKPFDVSFEEVLGHHFKTIEHTESIVWHGLSDELDEEKMRALSQQIAASGVTVDPTLIAQDNLVRVAQSSGAYLNRPGTDTINPLFKMLDAGTYEFWSNPMRAEREAPRAQFYRAATMMMHEAGVPLVAGTDAGIFTNLPGSSLTRELELLVKAGLTPHEALETATVNGGALLGFEKTGQVAPGYRANLILVSGDPLSDVSLVENPDAVILRGVVLDADKLNDLREGATQTSTLRTARRAIAMFMSL